MEQVAALFWTPGFLDRFQATLGYDLLPNLPLIFGPQNTWGGMIPVYDETYAFGNDTLVASGSYDEDYREVLNDGYKDYLSHLREWAHSFGKGLRTQVAYNLPLQVVIYSSHTILDYQLILFSLATFLWSTHRRVNHLASDRLPMCIANSQAPPTWLTKASSQPRWAQ